MIKGINLAIHTLLLLLLLVVLWRGTLMQKIATTIGSLSSFHYSYKKIVPIKRNQAKIL